MSFKKGQSGNPNGRPPKNRAWTKILEAAGNKTITAIDGQKIARKKVIAELALQAASTGKVVFPDGTKLDLSPKDWMDMLWKVYGQIDGPPQAEIDVTSGGQSVQLKVVYDDAAIPDTSEEATPEADGLYRESGEA